MLTKLKSFSEKDLALKTAVLDRIFEFVRGETSSEADKVRKSLQSEIDYLTDENTNLAIELNEAKRKLQNYTEKSTYLESKWEDSQQEAHMYKERIESMLEENRKL